MHVALSNFYWYAGLFAPAVLHAKAAWSVNQFAVSTNMLIRIVAAAGRAALVTDDVHDSVAWMQHAREALPALYALPVTAKRLGTAASQLRREALVEPTQDAIARAERALAAAIKHRLRAALGQTSDDALTAAWVKLARDTRGPERARWMSVEHVVNNLVGMLVIRCWMGHGDALCRAQLRTFADEPWKPLRRGRFWRIAARADRLLLQTIVADMLGRAAPVDDPPARYARALDDGLLRDPGREKISAVRETIDALEWFAPSDGTAAKLLREFRRRFDERVN